MTPSSSTTVRLSKCALLLAIALYLSLVVFNNITDYNSNYQFVRHVLMMDTTFPGNRGLWRAIDRPSIHTLFYVSIIAWETFTATLCWLGAARMIRQCGASAPDFQRAKSIAIAGLTVGCILWFTAFLTIGGEWFLMWQSHLWDGRDPAFRMFVIHAIVLLYISLPEFESDAVRTSL